MGLDETNLHVLMASGTPVEQIHAETVYKLLSRGKHWVLGKLDERKVDQTNDNKCFFFESVCEYSC